MEVDTKITEEKLVKERYLKRNAGDLYELLGENMFYVFHSVAERELKIIKIIRKKFSFNTELKVLEVGAGIGSNLLLFKRLGLSWRNIFANELIDSRAAKLKENLPHSSVIVGNAIDLNFKREFDIVCQFTVFTSILNEEVKKQLADKMLSMTKPGGIILWYDFKFNNPKNKDVKGIGKAEIRKLFSQASKIEIISATLAPPIGRKLGRFYPILNFLFPFLRSHLIAVIHI
jgi:2-polyprenyl-3-methyl-5-hydroxy-6-metoxy-1,4-benzoquinol methylase